MVKQYGRHGGRALPPERGHQCSRMTFREPTVLNEHAIDDIKSYNL